MQNVVIEKPYRFIPPHRGTWWPSLIQRFRLIDRFLRKSQGLVEWEIRGAELLQESLRAGHGILLTPNHARPCDPIVIGLLARQVHCQLFAMASWHLYHKDWFTAMAITKMGGFSVYREGVDRQAINMAIDILDSGERPLVIFPEGAVTRTNDRLHALLDGVAFIARTAAKRRERRAPGKKVVVDPIALKYRLLTDLEEAVDPVLTEIEHRLTWKPQRGLPMLERVTKIGLSLLSLKEIEYLGKPQSAKFEQRLKTMINHLLEPLEEHWIGTRQEGGVVPRVKALRMKIMPDMVEDRVDDEERSRRWRDLEKLYLAQQIASYPHDYLTQLPSTDRVLETVERFEEDLTDKTRVYGPMKVIIQIGEPIVVSSQRARGVAVDPLMTQIQTELQGMLDHLASESPQIQIPGERSRARVS